MKIDQILSSWEKKVFSTVYWLEGEENYFIDHLIDYAEHNILLESEAEFNLTIFYGRDAEWPSVINACRRYPMFCERQVVILKEAQLMREIEKLDAYINSPLQSTIFIIGYKAKGLDKRKSFYKIVSSKAVLFQSAKIKDDKVHQWITEQVKLKGYSIKPKTASLLEEHIGNDLSRINNEIEKLTINLGKKKSIDDDDIEKYIGISKEYNIFELLGAITKKDLEKALKITNYFKSNPKAAPIQMSLPALYAQFSRVYAVYGLSDKSDAALKPYFYYNPASLAQAHDMMKNYGYEGIEKLLLLLHQYNLKSVGVGDGGTLVSELFKEMVVKMMAD